MKIQIPTPFAEAIKANFARQNELREELRMVPALIGEAAAQGKRFTDALVKASGHDPEQFVDYILEEQDGAFALAPILKAAPKE